MRAAVCTPDMDARHALSRLADEALSRHGVLPELTLFPMPPELLAVMAAGSPFDVGARFFIENPVSREKLDRAITRCLNQKEMAL